MCCFSREADYVSDTRIFARRSGKGGQFLAYQMEYGMSPRFRLQWKSGDEKDDTQELAMILPLPVRLPARADSVRFIALDSCRDFFDRLASAFPTIQERDVQRLGIPTHGAFGVVGSRGNSTGGAEETLGVQRVGDYEATFVPTLDDFSRLDPRFKLPRAVWDKIPAYRDYGFAVFKLRDTAGTRTKPHPMAFEFETRFTDALYFPTVHIHDGKVHPEERFSHTLYMQDRRLKATHLLQIPPRIPRWLLYEDLTPLPPKPGSSVRPTPASPSIRPADDLPPMVAVDDLRRRIKATRRYFLFWQGFRDEIGRNGFPITVNPFPAEADTLTRSRYVAGNNLNPAATQGLIAPHDYCHRRRLDGELPNRDVIVAL